MLYGKPTKLVRHVDETEFTIEPQRFHVHTCWNYYNAPTARTDGLDLQDEKYYPVGSRIEKHKLEILVTPETIEPQQLYIGRIKLSFHDVYSRAICGDLLEQPSYQGVPTQNAISNAITPQLYPIVSGSTLRTRVGGADTANREIGGSGSGYGIKEWMLDDHIKHFINMKKITVFDQRPLLGSRWQRIPSKVKRINEGTFYGLIFFNDSPRGATPADTQLTVNLKEYIQERAI